MDMNFNEQQRAIQSSARDFFQNECPTTVVRELEESDHGYSQEMWKRMADLGWLGLTYPERYGGSEGGLLDLYVIYIEMGRSICPSPHLSTAIQAGETILAVGNDDQKESILPKIAAGEMVVTPAFMEPAGEYGPTGIQMRAAASPNGYTLNGAKILAPYAQVAQHLLVAARTGDAPEAITLFLVDPHAQGIAIERMDNIAGYPLFAITIDNVSVDAANVVGEVDGGWSAMAPVMNRAVVLQCAEIVGAGERVMELAVGYAKDRVQFGRPIGQYQAVQYLCSDIAIGMHLTSLLSREAAWLIDEGEPSAKHVSIAKGYASGAIQLIVHQGQEVHAGVAFMLEHDMQLYTRRAKHWEFNLGDAAYHYEKIAEALEA